MNDRQRISKLFNFEKVESIPNVEIGLWHQTRKEWEEQGLPKSAISKESEFLTGNKYFKLSGFKIADIDAWYPVPRYSQKIIEEDENTITYRDEVGRIRRAKKEGTFEGQRLSMDTYLDFPVKDRASYLKQRKLYENNLDKRYPSNWKEFKNNASKSKSPLILMNPLDEHFGYYSMLRSWIGTINLSYMFFDNPKLIKEICDFFTQWIIALLTKAVKEVNFDLCIIHEDLAGKGGPLISPDLFKKFFFGGYKKVVSFLKDNGVSYVAVDSDGDFKSLIPMYLDIGIDGFMPMEVAAGMDPLILRKKFGKSFFMMGGVDKREIAKGEESIIKEMKKLKPVIEEGGYLPTIDHTIQPGLSLDNFKYYLKIKNDILNFKSLIERENYARK